jgi:N-acetylneuraminate synthase
MEQNLEKLLSLLGMVRMQIRESHVVLPNKGEVKLYHHSGFENFTSVGAAFINVIQHDYCKFIVVMLPNQTYPLHFHRIKDESYFILSGDLNVVVEEDEHTLLKGDILNVPRRFTHSFKTKNGCVFEEISTAYLDNDSVYDDKRIQQAPKSFRTTVLPIEAILDEDWRGGKKI